jgi:hypothetical protein
VIKDFSVLQNRNKNSNKLATGRANSRRSIFSEELRERKIFDNIL